MLSRRRLLTSGWGFILLLISSLLFAGCFEDPRGTPIASRTTPQSQAEIGLGPGVHPLSYGPGEKGSPTWSPSGERIAFTVDGYVVEKAPADRDYERLTTKDFKARSVAWMSPENTLIALGADSRSDLGTTSSSEPLTLYSTASSGSSLEINRIHAEVQTISSGPGNKWILIAVDREGGKSGLALVKPGGKVRQYAASVEGDVTGMSVSAAGKRAVLAVRDAASNRFQIYTFSLLKHTLQRVAELEEGLEILGDPQWTEKGVYYVAGEKEKSSGQDAAPFDLYQIPPDSSRPVPAPGVGDDFVASNAKRGPAGKRLALIGRRNPGSSENLYILNLASENLKAATSNEEMQIKTGTDDLAWSADGESVVVVARAILSEPEVYPAPADTLVTDFYNLYEVSIGKPLGGYRE